MPRRSSSRCGPGPRRRAWRYAITDATSDAELETVARACRDQPFLVTAAGLAIALVPAWRAHGLLAVGRAEPGAVSIGGRCAVLAGSCSAATLEQVAVASGHLPSWSLDPLALAADASATVDGVVAWASGVPDATPVLIASSQDSERVAAVQARLGRVHAGALIERTFGAIAQQLVARGVRRLVVAGGETSGAVLDALAIRGLRIGPVIEPGVPWMETLDEPRLALALKSGNFGGRDFFLKAMAGSWAS